MTSPTFFRKIASFLIFLLFSNFLFCEAITDTFFGYSIDLPEGYELKDYSNDASGYYFLHPNIPVSLVIKIVDEKDSDCSKVLENALKKLSAKYEIDNFLWNEKSSSISNFSMNLDQSYSGWATCSLLKNENSYLVLLCYAPSEKESSCEQFIFSTLNSTCTDLSNYCTSGMIVSYAFPKEGNKTVELNIDGKKIKTFIDKSDEEASQWLVDMEYSVLTLYAKHPSWKEAWQRYYRMIYKDSFSRIENVSKNLAEKLYDKKNQIEYAQKLLTWVQYFDYFRGEKSSDSDFTSIPKAICGVGNDCDSRSLLLCILLKSVGIETIMIFSPEYSHAMAATLIDKPGQKYNLPNTNLEFLMGETTAKVTWGTIAAEHADKSKWIDVVFP